MLKDHYGEETHVPSASKDSIATTHWKRRTAHLSINSATDISASLNLPASERNSLEDSVESGSASRDTTMSLLHALPRLSMVERDASNGNTAALGHIEFEVRELLGEGGMGIVQSASQHSLAREVAVKRLKPEQRKKSMFQALLREARCTGSLEHPNIIPIHTLGQDEEGSPVLVMKRVEGVSWHILLQDPAHPRWDSLPTDRLSWHIEVLIQLCNALHFAHSKGVLHRDIKPSNVMIGNFGEVYLLDWGLAYTLTPSQQTDPEQQGLTGSPAYMAPEMLAPTTAGLNERSDVYLLGSTLHEVLTGTYKHQGQSLAEVFASVESSAPHDYHSDIPHSLATLCNHATHRDPAQRPPNVQAFQQALTDFLRHQSSNQLYHNTYQRLQELRRLATQQDHRSASCYRTFYECRFGFEQALKQWPENQASKAALEESLRLMFDFEVAQRNRNAAFALLDEMTSDTTQQQAKLQALEQSLAAEAAEKQSFRLLQQEFDLDISQEQRTAFLRILTLSGVLVILVVVFLRRVVGLPLELKPTARLYNSLIAACSYLAILTWHRHAFLRNRINQTMAFSLLIALLLNAALRFFALRYALPMRQALLFEFVLNAGMAAFSGLTIRRWFFLHALIMLSAAFLVMWLPDNPIRFYHQTMLLCLFVALWVGVRRKRLAPQQTS